jgi:hypothetical protein
VGELSTFQAILCEGSNCIEFRYGVLWPGSTPTVGIENQDGTDGFPGGFGPAVVEGDCVVLCPVDPCEEVCDCDLNNDGVCDTADFMLFLDAFGSSTGDPNFNPDADYFNDGVVGLDDYAKWYECFCLANPGVCFGI